MSRKSHILTVKTVMDFLIFLSEDQKALFKELPRHIYIFRISLNDNGSEKIPVYNQIKPTQPNQTDLVKQN
ncbi:hypothetical protein YC2023_025298 [Brassica napus]